MHKARRVASNTPSTGKTLQVYLRQSKTYVDTLPVRVSLLADRSVSCDAKKRAVNELEASKDVIFEMLVQRYIASCLEYATLYGATIDSICPETGEVQMTMLHDETTDADALVAHMFARGFNHVAVRLAT